MMDILSSMILANDQLDRAYGVEATLGARSLQVIDKRTGLPTTSATTTPATIIVRLGKQKVLAADGSVSIVDTAKSKHVMKVGDYLTINGQTFQIADCQSRRVKGVTIGYTAVIVGT